MDIHSGDSASFAVKLYLSTDLTQCQIMKSPKVEHAEFSGIPCTPI